MKKRTPKRESKSKILDSDIKTHSMEDIMLELYGPKGTKKRDHVDLKIKENSRTVGQRNMMKALREDMHKTQKQVAASMEVDDSVVSKFESNFMNSQISTFLRYAKALDALNVDISIKFKNHKSQVLHLSTNI